MEEKYGILKDIGLTDSEIKVYLALLKLGISSKGDIVKEAKIASSKIYEVLDKLIDKGLCSFVVENKVKKFTASSPAKIKDYLSRKKQKVIESEKQLEQIIPILEKFSQKSIDKIEIQVFLGWEGMETIYDTYLKRSNKEDEIFIMGAGIGEDEEKLETFYSKYGRLAFNKRLKIKAIFNLNSRDYVKKIEKNIEFKYNKRFLFNNTPSELLIFKDVVIIIIRRTKPVLLVIKDKETYNSFKEYFKELWKIAKK